MEQIEMRVALARRALRGIVHNCCDCDASIKQEQIMPELREHHFTCAFTFVKFALDVLDNVNYTPEEVLKMYHAEDGK